MKRIMLTVAYDGTAYHGWQVQDNGITIEGELNRAINELTGEVSEVIGGSRTDSGVHALCNVAVFDTESMIPGEKFSYALNAKLPDDIRVIASAEVAPDFHPRHCNTRKTYEYKIYNAPIEDPIKRLYYHHTYVKLDVALMREAASYFIGEHDFSSFCSAGAQVDSKVRTIYSLEVLEIPCDLSINCAGAKDASTTLASSVPARDIIIRVSGNGFLYNMVRIIAGTLMEVGRGAIAPSEIPAIIEAMDRNAAGPTAPARGLVLSKYEIMEE